MLLYHGTTTQRAEAILSGSVKPSNLSAWTCSDGDEYLYFWSPHELLAVGEAEEPEYALDRALQNALESARIQAALSDDPVNEVTVLVFDIDEAHIEPDLSCENMTGSGSVRVEETQPRRHIATYTCTHNPRLDAFYAAPLLGNQHLISCLPEGLEEAAKLISESGAYIELYELDNPCMTHGSEPDLLALAPKCEHVA